MSGLPDEDLRWVTEYALASDSQVAARLGRLIAAYQDQGGHLLAQAQHLARLKAERDQAATKAAALTAEVERLRAERNHLSQQLEAEAACQGMLRDERDQLREALEDDDKGSQILAQWEAIAAADMDRDRLAGEVERLHSELTEAQRVSATLRASRAEIRTELNSALIAVKADRDRLAEQSAQAMAATLAAIDGEFALTNAEMAALAQLSHDTRHEECGEVWRSYFRRIVIAHLDGGDGRD